MSTLRASILGTAMLSGCSDGGGLSASDLAAATYPVLSVAAPRMVEAVQDLPQGPVEAASIECLGGGEVRLDPGEMTREGDGWTYHAFMNFWGCSETDPNGMPATLQLAEGTADGLSTTIEATAERVDVLFNGKFGFLWKEQQYTVEFAQIHHISEGGERCLSGLIYGHYGELVDLPETCYP